MSLIIAENITQVFGAQEVLRKVSIRVSESDRIGLIGPNGEGKTTLLRIIAGELDSTWGQVHRSRGLAIGYLPQETPAVGPKTVHDAMLEVFEDLRRVECQLHELAARMEECDDPALVKRYGSMQSDFETGGGYDYNSRIEQVLTGLGFTRDMWSRPLAQLSGGERTRAYLATLLLKDPDVLLLDEPTNHLDLGSVEWLEYWLQSYRGALIVVSHDRYFLDSVTADTWEVAFGDLETYRGSYSKYLTLRSLRYKERLRRWQAQQEYISKTRDFIARHLAGQRTKEAQGRRKRLERFMRDEAIDRPQDHRTINLTFSSGARTGDLVLRASDLAVGYDPSSAFVEVERLEVWRGDRVAILGSNGIGKTTLLRTLLGELPPLSGTVHHGAKVNIGYLSQTQIELDPEHTALDSVLAADQRWTSERARSLLGSLLLGGDDALKRIGELSGGQRSRVVLARLVVQGANVLMLDEPTNHLDIPSTEVMQEVLQQFEGTVIFVSHDRYLVQAVATHIWAVDGGQLRCVLGGWQEYQEWRAEQSDGKTPEKAAKEDRKADYRRARKQANLVQQLKRRHEELEVQIESSEQDLAKLNDGISAAGENGDVARVEKLGREYEEKDNRLRTLWDEWEQVGEKLE